MLRRAVIALILTLVLVSAAQAQGPRGTIVGMVKDTSQGVVPGVEVVAINEETNVVARATTNDRGLYEIRLLIPGRYTVQAEMPGFKTWKGPGVQLQADQRLEVDIVLQVGEVNQVVEVLGAAPILDNTSAAVDQVFESKAVSELPMRNGSIAYLFSMAPGVALTRLPRNGPWGTADNSRFSVAGSADRGFDFNLDGVANNATSAAVALVPHADLVQEVKVVTSAYDASQGHSTGGAVNITLKSGTNNLDGSVEAMGSKGPMRTRDFFANKFIFDPATGPVTDQKIDDNTPPESWMRYNAVAGGPVILPHLYNGKDKTFWMFGLEIQDKVKSGQSLVTLPTEAQRKGDFSSLLALGSEYQIYDPLTTVPASGGRFKRTAFAGNIIPDSRINPVARKLISYYPQPNAPGNADGVGNYVISNPELQDFYQAIARIDHNFSERHRIFGRYSKMGKTSDKDRYIPGSNIRGAGDGTWRQGVSIDDVYTISPTAVIDFRYGLTRMRNPDTRASLGMDISDFQFPPSLLALMDPAGRTFPEVNINSYLTLGQNGPAQYTVTSHQFVSTLNWIQGKHSLKFGVDLRLFYNANEDYGNVSPQMNFNETYTRGPLDNSPSVAVGQGLASFLLGIPATSSADMNGSSAELSPFYAGFVHDDMRLTSKLTVNLGVRWEYEGPMRERFDRTTRQFDFVTPNPVEAAVQAAYAKKPIPQVPVDQFRILGGVTFAGVGGNPRTIRDPYYRALMPRVGFAYQLMPQVVVRGGYGIFFGLTGAELVDAVQPGFSKRTTTASSLDNGQTYIASISNPLPFGIERPLGAGGGLTTFLGQSPGFFWPELPRPYTQRWSLTTQFGLGKELMFEVGYIGSRSVRLPVSRDFNAVPAKYLSTSATRDSAVIDALSANVANPFLGIPQFAGSTFYSAKNVTVAQLLRPFPQFGSLTTDIPTGASWYHGMTLRLDKRFSQGLQASANYTWSKNMAATKYLNPTDAMPEQVIADLDRPHRLGMNALYQIPFGMGRQFESAVPRFLNHVVGGWNVSGIYQYQAGAPLSFGNYILLGDIQDLKLPEGEQSLDRWFNTNLFEKDKKKQLDYNVRTLSSRFTRVRADNISIVDLSLQKEFRIREGLTLRLQVDAQNAFNHADFGNPNTNPTNSNFGRVTATETGGDPTANKFVGLKLIF